MPKPSAYYFYMQEQKNRKPQWRNKGLGELKNLCSEGWNSLSEEAKQKYRDMKENNTDIVLPKANKTKAPKVAKGETSLGGQDSRGNSLMDIHMKEKERKEMEFSEYRLIQTIVRNLKEKNSPSFFTKVDHYVIKTTNYCITDVDPKIYCPAEITIAKFNIATGFNGSVYNAFCKVNIPFGYTLKVKETCEQILKIPHPYEDAKDVKDVAKEICEVMQKISVHSKPVLVYTHPDERSTLIKNMECIFGNSWIPIRIMSFADLVSALYCCETNDTKFSPGVVCEFLDPNKRGIQEGQLCEYHENTDSAFCSTEIASKWCCGATQLLHTVYQVRTKYQHNARKNFDFGKMNSALKETGGDDW